MGDMRLYVPGLHDAIFICRRRPAQVCASGDVGPPAARAGADKVTWAGHLHGDGQSLYCEVQL